MQEAHRSPLWAKLMVTTGAVLLFTSGTALAGVSVALDRYEGTIEQRDLFGQLNPTVPDGVDLTGPLNFLLAGLDSRPGRPHEAPRADSIIIAHVPEGLDHAYLISLPRDTLVDIPPYEPTAYPGGRDRLNAAMFFGSRQLPGEELPDIGRGFELLSRTVSDLTGIQHFDAGAVIDFTGFTDVVDALGGITVELDERLVSEHRQPDGRHRPLNFSGEGFFGPQMVYEPGMTPCGPAREDGSFTCALNGWQALDVARQRYSVEGGDYGRQRHQQLILKAMLSGALNRDIVTNPVVFDQVLRAAGSSLIFDGRGTRPVEFAFALRHVRPNDLVTVQVKATNVGVDTFYRGEELQPPTYDLFAALQRGRLAEFLLADPTFTG